MLRRWWGWLLVPAVALAERVDGVAVVVGGDVVTLSELVERVGPGLPPASGPGADPARRRELLRRAAEDAAADKLLEKEAETQGIAPAPAEIDAAMADVKRANKLDDATLDRALESQGLTRQRYRDLLKQQLTRMKVVEFRVKSRISIGEDEIKARYARMTAGVQGKVEMQLRDIFLPTSVEGAQAKVDAARTRVAAGESFEQVARETGGPLADLGGDLGGWLSEGMMLPEVERVALALKDGEVSPVFQTSSGFHLLKRETSRTTSGAKPLADAREELRRQIEAERLQKATEEYIAELRRSAAVEIRLP